MLPRELKVQKLIAVALIVFLAIVADAWADSYPSRPITIVVPFPAGGPTDTLGRILAERMTVTLGQSVIIENPTGAAGTIGTGHVARSGAGWLHRNSRPLADARHQRRDLRAFVRPVNRFDRIAGGGLSGMVHRKSRIATKGLGGADRLAEGQSRQGDGGKSAASAAERMSSGPISRRTPARAFSLCPTAAPHP